MTEMPNSAPLSICPQCGIEVSGYLFLTPDWHTIRSYWCREHGDVVPRGYEYDEREHGCLPDVQDDLQHPIDSRDWRCESGLSEPQVSSEA